MFSSHRVAIPEVFALIVLGLIFPAFAQSTKGPEHFGGRLEHPSRARVRRVHEEAQRKLAGTTLALPPSQNRSVLDKDPNARASTTDPSFSWRPLGIVTPVKNQGNCGSCFVFASMAVFESNWAWRHPTELIDGSEQKVFNCGTGNCGGGLQSESTEYLATQGTCSESDKQYVAVKQPCTACPQRYKGYTWDWVAGAPAMPTRQAIKEAILKHGPVTTFIYAGGFGNYYNSDKVVSTDSGAGAHIVTIIGWDDTKSYPGGQGAWEIKNSWGPTWGRDGFGFVAYGVRRIGLEAIWVETVRPQ
jgi:C1A family cysteine protease